MTIDTLPEWWNYRPDTWDSNIFDAVVIHNEYRLPERFEPDDVIMDVGAHIGSFSYAAYVRGARQIYAYEAEPGNAALLRENAARLGARVVHAAVWRSDARHDEPISYRASRNAVNTGGGGIIAGLSGVMVDRVRFDDCVRDATRGGTRRIKCLKLDCEGSEFEIVASSRTLGLVDSICGEYHLSAKPSAHDPPRVWANLKKMLRDRGFTVRRERATDVLGHFWATRWSLSAALRTAYRRWQGQIASPSK